MVYSCLVMLRPSFLVCATVFVVSASFVIGQTSALPSIFSFHSIGEYASLAGMTLCIVIGMSLFLKDRFKTKIVTCDTTVFSPMVLKSDIVLSPLISPSISNSQVSTSDSSEDFAPLSLIILHGSQTGTARRLSIDLKRRWDGIAAAITAMNSESNACNVRFQQANIVDLKEFDAETLAEGYGSEPGCVLVFILSTWDGGEPAAPARAFITWLREACTDFRMNRSALGGIRTAVFGMGSSAYDINVFCKAAVDTQTMLKTLGAVEVSPMGLGDDATGDVDTEFAAWGESLIVNSVQTYMGPSVVNSITKLLALVTPKSLRKPKPKGNGKATVRRAKLNANVKTSTDPASQSNDACGGDCGTGSATEDNDGCTAPPLTEEDEINELYLHQEDQAFDMEDMGAVIIAAKRAQAVKSATDAAALVTAGGEVTREMVTPMQRASLTKEGYKIIGSHSAVKMCRWTKNQLRGRGGCYKHTCYGITSYQCMEATPSLACANKCTFCWRHHKNPVGTEWRWKTDDPEMIVEEAIRSHRQMIKEFKGAAGVDMVRLQEAFTIKHCALSLVGEPIFYPRINEMIQHLHNRRISTFLVTNAQFPEAILSLSPVTQLYVSVDAATRDTLKAVDRPLFKDFWERFIASLTALKEKKQRTVYRLTLVKEANMEEIEQYAELVKLGVPDFIEVKSVTFAGSTGQNDITMKSVPWHEEVVKFCQRLSDLVGDDYDIASEHQHSCLVLLAKKSFRKPDGSGWRTWIDYDKFHQLVQSGEPFTSMDYMADTPSWATYGNSERGMDPVETRHFHNRTVRKAKEGLLSEEQLMMYPTDPSQATGPMSWNTRKELGVFFNTQ